MSISRAGQFTAETEAGIHYLRDCIRLPLEMSKISCPAEI